MERVWTIVSLLCLLAATLSLLLDYYNVAFVVAALGAVAWFLSYRVKLRATVGDTAETTEDEEDDSEDQDEE